MRNLERVRVLYYPPPAMKIQKFDLGDKNPKPATVVRLFKFDVVYVKVRNVNIISKQIVHKYFEE